MTVKTARPSTPFPGDGPLMKWLTTKGKPLITSKMFRDGFDRDMARFRKARESHSAHGILNHPLMIDGHLAMLELNEGRGRYTTTLTIDKIYLRETCNANRFITIGTSHPIPTIMAEGLIGKNADQVIELPSSLQRVITGRRITGYTQFDEYLTFDLSNKPW